MGGVAATATAAVVEVGEMGGDAAAAADGVDLEEMARI